MYRPQCRCGFDDPNLVSCTGPAAVLALTAQCGLATLLTERLQIAANATGRSYGKKQALDGGIVDFLVGSYRAPTPVGQPTGLRAAVGPVSGDVYPHRGGTDSRLPGTRGAPHRALLIKFRLIPATGVRFATACA